MIEPSEGRNDVEVLAEEYLTRRRNGEHPSIAEYVTSYPELADEIHEVFPAVDLMEKLRPGSMDLTSGHAGSMSKTVKLKSIGDYRILREIGRGGMGVVYEAQQRSLGRRVALKVLPRHASDSAAALERFRREARVAAQLHHTNIVPVFEVGEEDDTCYYAMQFIQGQSLDSVQQELVRLRDRSADRRTDSVDARSGAAEIHTTQMAQDDTNSVTLPGPLKLSSASTNLSHYFRSVAKLGYRVAQALGHAHSRGIVHRDVKPSNLLLDGQGDVWVADFGLAKTGGDAITRTGDLLGTVRYMSPERFNGQCDERADIYGLGMSLYELLTLKPAYAGKNHAQLVESICHREPSHPRAIDPHIPLDLETIVLKAIDKDPRRRYQSAADLAEDLKRFIDDEPVKARRISSVERLSRWARRNKSVAASLATVATLLVLWVVAATVAAAHFSQQEQEQRALKEKESNAKAEAQELAEDRRSRLVRLNVARAAQAMEQDDLLGSLPWFVEALRLDSDDPSREQLHRTRLAAVWARCPRLIHLWSYPYRPDQVEYSKDGRHLLIACPDRVVVRDSISGDEVFELRHHWAEPVAALSPDGRTLLVADTPKTVTLFDIPSGERKGPAIELNSNVTCAAFSPDNRLFAVGDNQGLTRVFDPKSLKAIGEPIAHQARVQHVAFSPNSRFVLTGSRDKTARIWVARTGEPWGPPLEHDDAIQYVGFRPDGERVVTTSHDRTARLWGITSGKQYAVFKHRSLIVEANFSPDSKRLVTASFDQTAQIWDADSGKAITPPLEHKHVVQSARFSPDGKRVVTAAEDQTARVWDSTTGKQVAPPLRHANVLLSAEFHPDGKHVATASQNGIVRQWLLTGSDQMSPPQRHGSYVFDVDVSADGWVMATASSDKTARIWNVETGEPVSPPLVHDANVTRVQFSPDGSRVVTAALDFTIRIWDARTGRPLTPPLGPTGWSEFPRNVHHDRAFAAFSPDGRFVAGGFSSLTKRTGVVRVWDAETGKPSCPSMVHNERINDIVFGPQGERLATAGVDKKAFLWRVADGERMLDIDHAAPVNSVRFSTDGKRLATATGYRTVGEARVWDAETGQPTSLAMKHQGSVRVAAFSPDGTRIATCSNDHTARIWDAETGRPISAPIPHGDQVRHVEFSPDGQCIVTCAWGMYYDDVPKRGVRVWDASTGQPIAPLPLHHRNTFVARFTSDSLGVAIASTREQTGKLWNLRPDQRPLQDWIDISQLVSGQSIDSSDALTPADVPDLVAANRSLRTKYPSDFHREPDQQLASVREAAQRCVQARQWSAAKSYIDTLRTAGSDDEGLRRMANEVAWALLNEPVSGGAEDAELLELAQFAIPKTRHGAKGAIQWSVLKPLAMRSTNGAALVLQEDESILVAGENPKADSYIVLCDTHLRGITGLKLETLPHHTLPGNGPGRHPSGRFMLSEITLRAARLSSSDAPVRIPLKSASATFNQTSGHVEASIDGSDVTGWGIGPRQGRPQYAVYETDAAIDHDGGSRLTVQLSFRDPTWFKHGLGRFRLLATTEPQPLGVEQYIVEHSTHKPSCWTSLAMAQLRVGEAESAQQSLQIASSLNNGGAAHDWLLMSLMHWELGDRKSAHVYFDRAHDWMQKNGHGAPVQRLAVQGLALRAKDDPTDATWPQRRSELLLRLGRDKEAIDDLSRAIAIDTENVELYKTRGNCHARRAEWKKAASDFHAIVNIDPDDHFNWYLALPLLLHTGRAGDYHVLRTQALERFGGTEDTRTAERIAKACLLHPMVTEEEAEAINQMAEYAVKRGARSSSIKWFHAAAAMADYRRGNLDNALRHTARSHQLAKSNEQSLDALAHLIDAMCHSDLGKSEEALASLSKGSHTIERAVIVSDRQQLPSDWYNWLICLIVQEEAQRVVQTAN